MKSLRIHQPRPYNFPDAVEVRIACAISSFMLVAAMNPCPCGLYGDMKRQCRCSPRQIEQYRQRISGPLLDRIDIHVEVSCVSFREFSANTESGESSVTIRQRVKAAGEIQQQRFARFKTNTNATMTSRKQKTCCQLDKTSRGYFPT